MRDGDDSDSDEEDRSQWSSDSDSQSDKSSPTRSLRRSSSPSPDRRKSSDSKHSKWYVVMSCDLLCTLTCIPASTIVIHMHFSGTRLTVCQRRRREVNEMNLGERIAPGKRRPTEAVASVTQTLQTAKMKAITEMMGIVVIVAMMIIIAGMLTIGEIPAAIERMKEIRTEEMMVMEDPAALTAILGEM